MGTDYSVACIECKLFIDLHKWPVIEESGDNLRAAYFQEEQHPILPEISDSPFVYFDCKKGLDVLANVHKEEYYAQDYIKKLAQALKIFLKEHKDHTLILTCDMGVEPWQIGEPVWYQWKEIHAAFHFNARFLPRNLIDDLKFSTWEQVIDFYEKNEGWFLNDQLKEQREELKRRFNELIKSI